MLRERPHIALRSFPPRWRLHVQSVLVLSRILYVIIMWLHNYLSVPNVCAHLARTTATTLSMTTVRASATTRTTGWMMGHRSHLSREVRKRHRLCVGRSHSPKLSQSAGKKPPIRWAARRGHARSSYSKCLSIRKLKSFWFSVTPFSAPDQSDFESSEIEILI